MYYYDPPAHGYHGLLDWLGEQFQPVVSKAGDPLREELEAGGAALKRELEEGGATLRAELAAGEARLKRTVADTIVLGGAGVIALWLWMRK